MWMDQMPTEIGRDQCQSKTQGWSLGQPQALHAPGPATVATSATAATPTLLRGCLAAGPGKHKLAAAYFISYPVRQIFYTV